MKPHWPKVQQWQRDDSMLLADMIDSLLGNPVERPKYESLLADDRLAPRLKEKPSEPVPQYITKTLKKEGGYQSNREDKGNWTGGKVNVGRNLGTNFGITPVSWAEFLIGDGKGVNPESKEFKDTLANLKIADIQNITKDQAIDFYKKRADKQFKLTRYPPHLKNQIFDIMTHSGYKGGMRLIQKAAGTTPDGLFGTKTLNAIQNLSNNQLAKTREESFSPSFKDDNPGVIARARSFAKSKP